MSNMIAYCGLDCSKCIGYIATQSGDPKELAKVAKTWSIQFNSDIKPEHVICDGCKDGNRKSYHCANLCKIRACCVDKRMKICVECEGYPCRELRYIVDNVPEAKSNLERIVGFI
jgi:hypothetical protein